MPADVYALYKKFRGDLGSKRYSREMCDTVYLADSALVNGKIFVHLVELALPLTVSSDTEWNITLLANPKWFLAGFIII